MGFVIKGQIAYMGKVTQNQNGFSLVELSIVIIISGFLFATAVTGYKTYSEKRRIYATQAKIETVLNALDRFYSTYSRYPCPARINIPPTDPNYGVETDCTGAAPLGVSVAAGTVDHDGLVATARQPAPIRIGAIPFVTLKEGANLFAGEAPYQRIFPIGAEDVTDTYHNWFTYVVTERQATFNYFPQMGAVRIQDEHTPPNSLSLNPAGNNADYAVITHGAKFDGAYDIFGNQRLGGCAVTLPAVEQENCDNDDLFISSLRYDTGVDETDDVVVFRTWANYFLWDQADSPRDIYNLNTGNVGIGGTNPEEKLHVFEGHVVADDAAEPGASVRASQYCNSDGSFCFDPDIIGGNGVDCDVIFAANAGNLAATQIYSNTLDCDTIYNTAAPPQASVVPCAGGTEFIVGFDYDPTTKTLTHRCGTP